MYYKSSSLPFGPTPGILKMSHNKDKIFELSKVSGFIKYIFYWGFLYIAKGIDQSLNGCPKFSSRDLNHRSLAELGDSGNQN